MLDIKYIRENTEKVKKGAVDKGIDPKLVYNLLKIDEDLKTTKLLVEEQRAEQNQAAKDIAQLKDEEKEKAIAKMQKKNEEIKKQGSEEKLKQLEEQYQGLMLLMPSPALDKVPLGKDDQDNVEIKKWGEVPKFDFDPRITSNWAKS